MFMTFSSPRGNVSRISREKAIELARSNLDLARIVATDKVAPDNSLPVSLTTFLLSKHCAVLHRLVSKIQKLSNVDVDLSNERSVQIVCRKFELYESPDPLYLYFLDYCGIA